MKSAVFEYLSHISRCVCRRAIWKGHRERENDEESLSCRDMRGIYVVLSPSFFTICLLNPPVAPKAWCIINIVWDAAHAASFQSHKADGLMYAAALLSFPPDTESCKTTRGASWHSRLIAPQDAGLRCPHQTIKTLKSRHFLHGVHSPAEMWGSVTERSAMKYQLNATRQRLRAPVYGILLLFFSCPSFLLSIYE